MHVEVEIDFLGSYQFNYREGQLFGGGSVRSPGVVPVQISRLIARKFLSRLIMDVDIWIGDTLIFNVGISVSIYKETRARLRFDLQEVVRLVRVEYCSYRSRAAVAKRQNNYPALFTKAFSMNIVAATVPAISIGCVPPTSRKVGPGTPLSMK